MTAPNVIFLSPGPLPVEQWPVEQGIEASAAWSTTLVDGTVERWTPTQASAGRVMILPPPPDDLFAPSVRFAPEAFTEVYTATLLQTADTLTQEASVTFVRSPFAACAPVTSSIWS